MDKLWDEDYYILTLAVLAKKLKGRGLCSASGILAVGLAGGIIGSNQEKPINKGLHWFSPIYLSPFSGD